MTEQKINIKFSKEVSDFIKNDSTSISVNGERYYVNQIWYLEIGENIFTAMQEEQVPVEVRELIKTL